MDDDDSDDGFLIYVDLHADTELALFSKQHVIRLLKLACVKPGEYSFPNRSFISVPAHVARPLIRRARRNLKRLENPQLELPFNSELGAEEYLLPDFSQRIPR